MTSTAELDTRITEAELRRLFAQQGFSVHRASKHFRCGESSILRRCARWGIVPKPSQQPVSGSVERLEKLRALLADGVPLMRCSIELDCALATVARMCALHGLRPTRAPKRGRTKGSVNAPKLLAPPQPQEHPRPRVECPWASPGATPGVAFADFVDLYQSVYTGLAARQLQGVGWPATG